MAYKGKFKPKNPKKYKGDPTNIIYRSLWERKFMNKMDQHPNVIWWQSEELSIPYKSIVDGKMHRYFPDFLVKMKDKDGNVVTKLIEIKPKAQTIKPKVKKNITPKYLKEVKTYGVNISKWNAADVYCQKQGWEFVILTEHELGIA